MATGDFTGKLHMPMPELPPDPEHFVTVWRTATASETITLPFITGYDYNCLVDWGDGSEDTLTTWNQTETTHTYATAGDYTVSIIGLMEAWSFANTGTSKDKILEIVNWGSTGFFYGYDAFYGCSNLLSVADGTLQLTNAYHLFSSCTSLTTIPQIDLPVAINITWMCSNSSSLSSYARSDLSSVTSFLGVFNNCRFVILPDIEIPNGVVSFQNFISNNPTLTTVPANIFDSVAATNYINAFQNCALTQTSVDNILVSIDTAGQSNGTLDIDGGTSSAPSATGLAAKTSLEGKGWTVTVNT